MSRALPPLDPEGLSRSPQFADGSWRDEHGRDLITVLVEKLGKGPAVALWATAEDLFIDRVGEPGSAVLPATRPRSDRHLPRELRVLHRRRGGTC